MISQTIKLGKSEELNCLRIYQKGLEKSFQWKNFSALCRTVDIAHILEKQKEKNVKSFSSTRYLLFIKYFKAIQAT